MFKQRLLTALILIPLVLWGILQANIWILSACVGGLWLIAGWEWLALVPVKNKLLQALFFCGLLGCVWASFFDLNLWLWCSLGLWAGIILALITYPRSQRIWGHASIIVLAAFMLLPAMLSAMHAIYQLSHGKELTIYLLFLIWATDSGAYLVGKKWGQSRLIPHVSPGKTKEGAFGGLLLACCVAGLGGVWFKPHAWSAWFGLAFTTALISMIGDLFISMLKRRCQLKDTGRLFPGHGGVLDRLDSLIAAAPVFYLGLTNVVGVL
jgi:phosphatidate cytidylyltransferase